MFSTTGNSERAEMCLGCGKENIADVKRCRRCGEKLNYTNRRIYKGTLLVAILLLTAVTTSVVNLFMKDVPPSTMDYATADEVATTTIGSIKERKPYLLSHVGQ